ncbi:MAG: hypothetical protein ABIF06_00045 [bacterium]
MNPVRSKESEIPADLPKVSLTSNGVNPEEIPQNTPTEPISEETKLSQIRTYQGDVAEAITNQKESLSSIQRGEVARKRTSGIDEGQHNTSRERLLLLILGIVVLVALGSFGGWYSYKTYKEKTAPPLSKVLENQFLPSVEQTVLNLPSTSDRTSLIKSLKEASDSPIGTGGIRHIVLYEDGGNISPPLTTQAFFTFLESRAPGSLVRSFSPLFMYGTLGGEVKSNFLIIRLTSFENAFAGMLSWEVNLADDIGPIFQTSVSLRNILPGSVFEDVATRNKDARVLKDSEGKVVILYSFFDNNTLIITDNLETLRTIISRLTAELLSR